jgi:hypothetical protein
MLYLIPGLFAVLLALGAVCAYWHERRFRAAARAAEGVVIDLQWSEVESDDFRGGEVWHPVIEFIDLSGRQRVFTASTGASPPAYQKGDRVGVLYSPEAPEDAKLDTFFSVWGVTLILAFMSAVLAFITGIFLLVF